jgi:hypothetical protein
LQPTHVAVGRAEKEILLLDDANVLDGIGIDEDVTKLSTLLVAEDVTLDSGIDVDLLLLSAPLVVEDTTFESDAAAELLSLMVTLIEETIDEVVPDSNPDDEALLASGPDKEASETAPEAALVIELVITIEIDDRLMLLLRT